MDNNDNTNDTSSSSCVIEAKPRTKPGRPKKKEVTKLTRGKTGNPVGRPKGEAAIMADYRARMLASPKSRKVLDVIFDAALDNDHKHQAAAWKLIADRILPVSQFEALTGSSSKPTITINISGVSDAKVSGNDIEGDYDIL
jgi:hypothetical protein